MIYSSRDIPFSFPKNRQYQNVTNLTLVKCAKKFFVIFGGLPFMRNWVLMKAEIIFEVCEVAIGRDF
jgi:hypothetical protein